MDSNEGCVNTTPNIELLPLSGDRLHVSECKVGGRCCKAAQEKNDRAGMFFYGSYLPITYFIIESCQSASYRGKQLLKRENEAMKSENMLSKDPSR